MWWRSGVSEVGRMADRISTIYLDRCRIDRHNQSITVATEVEEFRVPAATIACILLGPGTTVTHGAITLLADACVSVAWVGENGVRLYAAGTSTTRSSRVLETQARLVSRPSERIRVARAMYGLRFPDEDVSSMTMQQLLGREGTRVKRSYSAHAKRTGVAWDRRAYIPGKPMAVGDNVNRLLSAANAALYGISHAAIVGVGASPALGFVHTGSANSFVLDIADLYKTEITVPIAFDLAAQGLTAERDARLAVRDAVVEHSLMKRVVRDVLSLLSIEEDEVEEPPSMLWAGTPGTVSGGVNYDPTILRSI
ncbi:MAG: subtype I-E CRISPR-associated endonuclease Cas1 [Candidatus Lumbricidophila eiseniae]|uniref:CRISPR-associated endonuclease Cas1 n=1 Tax=Candidatus Lumbricidiphila eiseniae TaxID=1969409 RepID=A0A2A6FQJ7_9MICO|nr:MAG: subtype I-E CRISPR-associated endonuclease Cas1 [Candidatus Lumbricidophila eiseniae]